MSNDTNPTATLLDAVFEPFGDYAPEFETPYAASY